MTSPNYCRFRFVWEAAWYDLHGGMTLLVNDFVHDTVLLFGQQRALHIALIIIMVRVTVRAGCCGGRVRQGLSGSSHRLRQKLTSLPPLTPPASGNRWCRLPASDAAALPAPYLQGEPALR
jgi:hypothetical protein